MFISDVTKWCYFQDKNVCVVVETRGNHKGVKCFCDFGLDGVWLDWCGMWWLQLGDMSLMRF
jgi:hypothetical protein